MAPDSDGFYSAFVHQDGVRMFALEPQTSGLDSARLLDGQLIPWWINVLGQTCGPGQNEFNFSGIHGEAYIISPVSP